MLTFLELYQTMLGFVFYRLYSDINLVYPPKLDAARDDEAAGIGALLLEETSRTLTIEGESGTEAGLEKGVVQNGKKITTKDIKKQIRQINNASTSGSISAEVNMDEEAAETALVQAESASVSGPDVPQSLDADAPEAAQQQSDEELTGQFQNYYFYLSREVTRPTLEFVIRSFGGQVGWDAVLGAGSPYTIDDPKITHHIIDRPVQSSSTALIQTPTYPGKRAYIQPQWVVDCINLRKILPTGPYAPGSTLPPHLSPFVDNSAVREQGGYIPTEAGGDAVSAASDDESDAMEADDNVVREAAEEGEEEVFTGFGDATVDDEEHEQPSRPALIAAAADPDDESLMHAAELEAESLGIPAGKFQIELAVQKKANTLPKKQRTETVPLTTQEANPASILLSNKQRKLYNKMKFGENRRSNESEVLREKKKQLVKK